MSRTKLIDDAKSDKPRFRGLVHGTTVARQGQSDSPLRPQIVREEGIRGVYQGLTPVILRQAANSTVRFGS